MLFALDLLTSKKLRSWALLSFSFCLTLCISFEFSFQNLTLLCHLPCQVFLHSNPLSISLIWSSSQWLWSAPINVPAPILADPRWVPQVCFDIGCSWSMLGWAVMLSPHYVHDRIGLGTNYTENKPNKQKTKQEKQGNANGIQKRQLKGKKTNDEEWMCRPSLPACHGEPTVLRMPRRWPT